MKLFFFVLFLFVSLVECSKLRDAPENSTDYIPYVPPHARMNGYHPVHELRRRAFELNIRNRVWPPKPPTPIPTTRVPTTPVPITTIPTTTPVPITTIPPTTSIPTTLQPTAPVPGSSITPSVTFHNGVLVQGIPTLYYIYYGNWSTLDPLAKPLIDDFTFHLDGSTLYNIASTYYDNVGGSTRYLSNKFHYGGSYSNNSYYRGGTALSDTDIYWIINDAITGHHLPAANSSNMYFLLTSPDITATSGMCVEYCGWHSYAGFGVSGHLVQAGYGYIGSSIRCGGCSGPSSPNNTPNADSMMSIITHELFETVTDPFFGGWYDVNFEEVGDVCAWNYGLTYHPQSNPSTVANVMLGTRHYLVQMIMVNLHGGYCANILYL